MNHLSHEARAGQRPHSSYNDDPYRDVPFSNGVPLRCQFCSAQAFRRSSLRIADLPQMLLMRYPVRCLHCGQRQLVSFTVAGISIPSSAKPASPVHTRKSRAEPALQTTPSSARTDPPHQQ